MTNQLALPQLKIEAAGESDGLDMGVLSDGSAYLTQRALSKLCGIANSSLSRTSAEWLTGKHSTALGQWLVVQGVTRSSLYETVTANGVAVYAYPDDVCQLVVDYYALEVGNQEAKEKYRLFARAGLRAFVYSKLGYSPGIPPQWRFYLDRLALVSAPPGHFSVFKESGEFIVAAINSGLPVGIDTVPDGSIGRTWSSHWEGNDLAERYGERKHHPHNYPAYYPQAKSNPQEIWVYPMASLGEFRIWMEQVYLPSKYPEYLKRKVRDGALPALVAEKILAATAVPALKPRS